MFTPQPWLLWPAQASLPPSRPVHTTASNTVRPPHGTRPSVPAPFRCARGLRPEPGILGGNCVQRPIMSSLSLDALPHLMTRFSPSQHLPLIQSPPQHYLRRCHFSASQGVFLFKISMLPQILPPYLAQIARPCLSLLPMCPLWPPESGLPTHCSSPTKNHPHTHLFFILLTLPVSASMPPPPGSPPCCQFLLSLCSEHPYQ